MRYSTLVKQLFIVAKSKWFLHMLKGKLFSIASFEVVSNLRKMVPDLETIIDVGANSGQFSKVATHFYPNAHIDAFEPLPNLYSKVEKLFLNNSNSKTYNLALGNETGSIKFNKNAYGHISSVLEISKDNIHYPKQENDLSQIEVAIETLDNMYHDRLFNKGKTLLKLDVQGYELEVLKGGTETLKRIDYVIIEANLEKLYKDQPTFSEMNTYLMSKGFELDGMLDFNLGVGNKYIEVDFLYRKQQ